MYDELIAKAKELINAIDRASILEELKLQEKLFEVMAPDLISALEASQADGVDWEKIVINNIEKRGHFHIGFDKSGLPIKLVSIERDQGKYKIFIDCYEEITRTKYADYRKAITAAFALCGESEGVGNGSK